MKTILKYFILLLLLFFGKARCYAQLSGQPLIDSLLKEMQQQKEDTNKVKVLYALSYNYRNTNPDEGIKYGQQGLELATNLEWKKGIAWANANIGANYWCKSDYPHALEYDYKALKMHDETGDKQGVAKVMGNIGNVYDEQGDFRRALEYYLKALKIYEEIGNKLGAAIVTGNIGNVYGSQSDFPRALEYYFKALKMHEEIGDKQGVARVTGNISGAYTVHKNYIMAIAFGKKSLEITEEIGDKRETAYSLAEIGEAYLALTHDSVKDAGNAAMQDEIPAGITLPDISIPASKSTRLRIATEYLQRALDTAKKTDIPDVMKDCYHDLAEAYKTEGDFKKAMEYYDDYTTIKDSIFSKENAKKIAVLENQRTEEADSLKRVHEKHVADLKYRQLRNYSYLGIAGTLALLVFSFFIVRERGKAVKERKKSDGLLLNILPSEVAEELKDKGASEARYFDDVTILFTDFVNFTQAGEKMSPQALIGELDTCFKAFDDITAKYGIEKIKTIGDAYLAVGGLPAANPKHAEHVVAAAREISSFMAARYARLRDKTFEVRIGIHSGSVVAGIVGVKKFAYDIWGDTVNTAARLEQNCEAGRINISEVTYELVKDKFKCEYRGEIEAKNKGMMKMYYVVNKD